MAKLPIRNDPTLDAIDQALEKVQDELGHENELRSYLGMSSIGRSCWREGWYDFRWCLDKVFPADTIKKFTDGHMGEDLMAKRLGYVKDVKLMVVDPRTDKQFEYKDLHGHLSGHADGMIKGILQALNTLHVWEHKQVAEKKYRELQKLVAGDEKGALEKWDETYYVQAIMYMHYSECKRHYLTCSTPGGRETISARTNENKKAAKKYVDKALHIIQCDTPKNLEKVSENPVYWLCKYCQYVDICQWDALPKVNCRTCCHATPVMQGLGGKWKCERYNCMIPLKNARKGCKDHLYIPDFVTFAKPVNADKNKNWIEYQIDSPQGIVFFRNGKKGKRAYPSHELRATVPAILGDDVVDEIRKRFDGEVVG